MTQLCLPLETFKCQYYGECTAPLCPKDVNFGRMIWFPDEPVCRLRNAPDWVQKQRKISRLPGIDPNNYFTFRMLKKLKKIDRGLQGADPELITGERKWLYLLMGGKRKAKPVHDPKQGEVADFLSWLSVKQLTFKEL